MVDSWLGSTAALVRVLCNQQLLVTPATLRTLRGSGEDWAIFHAVSAKSFKNC